MKTEPRFEKVAIVLLALMVIGIALSASGRLLPIFYPNGTYDYSMVAIMTKVWVFLYAILGMFLNICIGVWLWRRSRMDSRPQWTWAALGVFGGILAPILYYLIPIYEKVALPETQPNPKVAAQKP